MSTPETTTFSATTNSRARHRQRGQSIVVALLVLLLLGFVGALFITIVARNLVNARHANRVLTADKYADAGIVYADAQLTNSPDGADWRPPLQYTLATPPTETRELSRYTAAVSANSVGLAPTADPDKEYLDAGYARYNTGLGRFLLRVTYTPVLLKDSQGQYYDPTIGKDAGGVAISPVSVPPGKYLKIESIGREGNIDPIDPTTYQNNRSTDRTQAYQVAYKPIGITDYARFETNPDNRSDIANLGVMSQVYTNDDAKDSSGMGTDPDAASNSLSLDILTPGVYDFNGTTLSTTPATPDYQLFPITTTYGAADAYLSTGGVLTPNPTAGTGQAGPTGSAPAFGGGSIHANMPVRFFGKNIVYLNDAKQAAPSYQDGLEIAGNLLLDSYNPTIHLDNSNATSNTTGTPPVPPYIGQQAALSLNPTDPTKPITTAAALISPTNAVTGLATDANPGFSTQGGLIRDGSMQNDINGLPRGIKRLEPPVMDGVDPGSSLPRYRAITSLSPLRTNVKNSDGTAYVPAAGDTPGLYGYGKSIYINNPTDVQTESTAIGGGTTLTDEWLHQSAPSSPSSIVGGWHGHLYDPPGVSITLGQAFPVSGGAATYGLRMVRSDGSPWKNPNGTAGTSQVLDVNYADLDTDRNSTNPGKAADNDLIIYAEGNVRLSGILSPNEGGTGSNAFVVPRHITIVTNATAYIEGNLLKGDPDSSITVLARDYVCVNTTQFLAGTTQDPVPTVTTGPQMAPAIPDALRLEDTAPATPLIQNFSFGLTGTGTPVTTYGASNLALYVSGSPETAGGSQADFDILDSAGGSVFNVGASPVPTFSTLTHATFDLSGTTTAAFTGATAASLFQLTARKDPGGLPRSDGAATQNFLLERVAVLPMDIRIEAVLYAQTRSFFVIPGDWFNTSPDDTMNTFANSITATNPAGLRNYGTGQPSSDQRFPLYGQPIDLKITIDGAVSEARPADISAQSAWMLKWGWIPQYHGTLLGLTGGPSSEAAGHSGRIGLQIIYNPQAGYPYSPGSTAATQYYLRSDAYGRPLPFAPKLPVSTALLYAGQSSEPPLLQ